MNSMKGILASVLLVAALNSIAQDKDPVLMTIAGKNITRSEFQSIYNKNNPKGSESDSKSIDEYVQLFVNFKLKVWCKYFIFSCDVKLLHFIYDTLLN